jgi:PAS domain S-box-containing protein
MGNPKRMQVEASSIRVAGINIEWHPQQGMCTFDKLPVAMMWVDTTLAGLLSGVQAMVGTERFLLALQSEGRKSVEADWQVISAFPDFRDGFGAIANIAAVAGWGHWSLTLLDENQKECRFRVTDSWESRYQRALGVCWGSGMLAGKLAGYCSKLFGTNCWADQTVFAARGAACDEFLVRPSPRSIEKEIDELLATDVATRADMAVALRRLEKEIAERQRMEEALRESEALFRSQFEYGNIGIAITSVEKRWLRVNLRLGEMLGYSEEELRQRNWAEMTHPDDLGPDLAQFTRMLAGEIEAYELDKRFFRKDGSIIVTHLNVSCFRNQDLSVRFVIASLQDVTERKRAEEALRESEEKFRNLVETTSDWIWETGADGTYTYSSPGVRALLGYEPAEVIDRKPFDFMPPDEAGRVVAEFARISAERRPFFNLENLNLSKDGRRVILETSGVPRLDPQGNLLGYRGIDRDITERKRAEAALREKEEFIRALLDTSRDWIWAIDLRGVHTYSNPAVRIILGYEVDQIIGTPWFSLIHEEDRDRIQSEVSHCIEARRGWSNLVVRWRHKEGGYRLLESNSVPVLDAGGEVTGFRGVDRDITERTQAEVERLAMERRLLHAQKLESLGILAGGVAHDFNNLLMAVIGNLDLGLLDLSPTSATRPYIERALQASRRAADLTRQMLAYSGKGRFVITHMDLSGLVRENMNLFRTAISRGISMKLCLTRESATIEADAGQVQQVIMNLITNASEAIGEKVGVITLTTGVEAFDAAYLSKSRLNEKPPAGRFAYVEASDTGCGMDEETNQRLFDPFFTTKFTGRGLGMATVLGIVKGHKGAIMVESAVGQGSTIRVLFPAAETLGAAMDSHFVGFPGQMGTKTALRTVLVVDDEQDVREVCAAFLQALGFQPIIAEDGDEGVRRFERHADEIDCVLLDLTMPRMHGISAFREMKRLRPDIPVILCSGYDEQEATLHFTNEGLAGFLQKPYTLEDLKNTIAPVLKKKI